MSTHQFGRFTAEEAKRHITSRGVTISQWARDNGYTPREVSLVLNGQIKGLYGKGFEIAVKLGMRPAPPSSEEQRAA